MKTTKRLIAFFMAAMMIFSVLPVMNVSAKTSGKWRYAVVDGGAAIYGHEGEVSEKLTIPSKIDGYPVTSIGNYAFENCSNLKSITIPDSVTSIGYAAFRGCTGLKSITIPDSVTSIGHYAFEYCSSLKSITIPDSVTSIGDSAFDDCNSLKSITIPDSVINIYSYAFRGCSSLKSITIPDSVTSISYSAFSGCSSLTSINVSSNNKEYSSANGVLFNKNKTTIIKYPEGKSATSYTIPDSVTNIGDYAFSGCSSLTRITIPNSVTNIGDGAFSYCSSLKSITIPDSVTSIGEYAFDGCSSLKSLTIPDSVTSIGGSAFYETGYYNNSSNWKNGVLYIGNHLIKAKDSIKGSYKIKSGTKCIAGNAFGYCTGLTSIAIPDSVTSIGSSAFYHCTGLKSITIPDSVTNIGGYAFYDCTSSTSITIPGSVKAIGEMAFGYVFDYVNNEAAPISGFTIKGHKGSAANTYAKENGFKFVSHKNNYTSKVNTKATTSKNGKITYTCTCGYSYSKSISKIKSITLSSDTFTYNGNVKQPTVTVKDSKGNTLKKGTDYTVKYSSGRKNVGKCTVTVTFKGKYSGSKTLTFRIKPKSTSISKLTAGKKQFTATWTKLTTQVSGYQLQYSTSSKMTNAKSKTLSGTSKNSLTITGLNSAKKYYVRIRTYKNVKIDGKTYKYYSAWSSVKSVKTK